MPAHTTILTSVLALTPAPMRPKKRMKLFTVIFTLPVLMLLAACGNAPAPREDVTHEADSATIRTIPQGELIGYTQDVSNGSGSTVAAHAWLGLPFAQAPVGDLRWRAARAPNDWEGRREALEFADWCVQYTNEFDEGEGYTPGELHGSEDCLYLNVYAPAMDADSRLTEDEALPVMVWVHGGGNTWGRAAQYDGAALAARENVIVVTVQYRLGPLGWMAHPALRESAELAIDRTANFGTFDIIAALHWVQSNIQGFGGDASRVTIFGESAGGHNVASLLVSPQAAGLFHRAIIQSGATSTISLAAAEGSTPDPFDRGMTTSADAMNSIIAFIAPPTPEQMAGAMRSIDINVLYETYREVNSTLDRTVNPARVIADGVVLPRGGIRARLSTPGEYNAVPIMTGANKDESKLFNVFNDRLTRNLFGIFIWPRNERLYDLIAEYQSQMWRVLSVDDVGRAMGSAGGSDVFAYRFDWDEAGSFLTTDFAQLLGAAHGWEIPFIFSDWNFGGSLAPVLWNRRNEEGRLALSRAMMGYWAEFARTGNPGTASGNAPDWTPWDDGNLIVFDTANGGGIHMEASGMTAPDVYARLAADSRVRSDEERCLVYKATIAWWPSTAQPEFMEGACEDFDLADHSL